MNKYLDTFYNWWKNIDKFLLFLILGLFLLGLFFSLVSTSLIASDKLNTKSYYFFFKHSAYIVLAIAILIILLLILIDGIGPFTCLAYIVRSSLKLKFWLLIIYLL